MTEHLYRHNTMARRALWRLERAVRRPTRRRCDAAVRAFDEVLAVMAPDHPDRPACLANLAAAQALAASRGTALRGRASGAVGPIGPGGARAGDGPELSDVAVDLRAAGLRTGSPALLDEAVELGRRAVAACPADHDHYAACLVKLGNSLHARYVHGVPPPDGLHETLEVYRAGVAAAPSGHPERASALNGLTLALRTRYEATAELDPLREAVQVGRRAVTAARGSTTRASCLANLGAAAQELFKRTGDPQVIQEAVAASRQAVELSVAGTPDLAGRSSDLANALQIRATSAVDRARAVTDLREATALARSAVDATPHGRLERGGRLSNLSLIARTLYERTGEAAPLREARSAATDAVAESPPGTLVRRTALLAGVRAHALPGAALEGIDRARSWCDELAAADDLPRHRVLAHLVLGRAAVAAREPLLEVALAAYEYAVARLPELAPRHLRRADREHGLGELAGLPAEAASVAVALGRPEHAVSLLESSRGLLLREGVGSRHDLDGLLAADPALAAELVRVRELLDDSDRASADLYRAAAPTTSEQRARRHHDLAREWGRLVEQVRAVPGMARFLMPPAAPDPRAWVDGTTVIVNPSRHRCDVVTIAGDGTVRAVPLDCTEDDLRRRAESVRRRAATSDAALLDDLAWLWDHVAAPALDDLGLLAPVPAGPADLPLLRWCPVGIASFLPWHAAGHHTGGGHPTGVADHVVSTTATTVRALRAPASPRAPDASAPSGGATLVVDAGHAPGLPALPGAAEEARRVAERTPGATLLAGRDATHAAVLRHLPTHRVAHFACHAVTDPESPALSRLLLHDHATAPLTVAELAAAFAHDADLAYLSACSTATSDERLADESVHIASALQLVGYRQVVATLWPIADEAALRIADGFHAALPSILPAVLRPGDVARALHAATGALRAEAPSRPSRWAAHVHLG